MHENAYFIRKITSVIKLKTLLQPNINKIQILSENIFFSISQYLTDKGQSQIITERDSQVGNYEVQFALRISDAG